MVSSAYCALVNDKDDKVLHEIINHLGLLESGALESHQKRIGSETMPYYMIRLDTKYYTCEVPLLCCHSLDSFLKICGAERIGSIEISAVLFCATRQQLTENFLAFVSKYSSCLEKAEIKALILREDDTDESTIPQSSNDDILHKFALSRCIEIIKTSRHLTQCLNDGEEEKGLSGVPRLLEAIETVRWPNMVMKPNPVEQKEHRTRLQKYIESELRNDEDSDNNNKLYDPFGAHFVSALASQMNNSSKNFGQSQSIDNNEETTCSDYPDSEDEEAILEWFDRPLISENICAHIASIPPPHNAVTNVQQSLAGDDNLAPILRTLNQVRLGNAQKSLKERIGVSESITYNFLDAISSADKYAQPRKTGPINAQEGNKKN